MIVTRVIRTEDLRHRVTIQRVVIMQDSIGGTVEAWEDIATVWAAVEPLRGKEWLEAQKVTAEITYLVRLRYLAAVSTSMRIKYKEKILEIVAVINIGEQNRELHLMCKEVV